jgi:hypothetical protein
VVRYEELGINFLALKWLIAVAAVQITHLGFSGDSGSHAPCLIACTPDWIHIWDLLTLEVTFSLQIQVQALSVHSSSMVFAVAASTVSNA